MRPLPRLLETYEEARLLLEAKGWGVAKAAEHLSEMPELARFHISHTKLSKKTTPGSKFPIEPEVAAAVEGLETRVGYERQTEIVTAGLLALHGDPPIVDVDVRQLATDLRERLPASELALKLVEALEEKAGHGPPGSSRSSRRGSAVPSGSRSPSPPGRGRWWGASRPAGAAPARPGARRPQPARSWSSSPPLRRTILRGALRPREPARHARQVGREALGPSHPREDAARAEGGAVRCRGWARRPSTATAGSQVEREAPVRAPLPARGRLLPPRRRRPEEASRRLPDRPSVPSRFPFQHLAQHRL